MRYTITIIGHTGHAATQRGTPLRFADGSEIGAIRDEHGTVIGVEATNVVSRGRALDLAQDLLGRANTYIGDKRQ